MNNHYKIDIISLNYIESLNKIRNKIIVYRRGN